MLKTSFFKFSFRKLKSKYEIILGWSFDVRDCFLCVQRFLEVEVGFCCFQARKTSKKSIFLTFCNFSRTMNHLNPKLFFLELWYQKGCFGKRKKNSIFSRVSCDFRFSRKMALKEWPLCMITSDKQISPPTLVCKHIFFAFALFVRSYSFQFYWLGNSFVQNFATLQFQNEAWWWNLLVWRKHALGLLLIL